MSSNKNLRIGIVGYASSGLFGVGISYMEYFSNIGDVEIISHTETETRDLDLLVIPGGPDVDTKRYLEEGDRLNLNVGKPCIIRERFDHVLLPKYIEKGTPIFGICRGHQTLAVHFGGKLEQDMDHETNPSDDRSKLVHNVSINNQKLTELTGSALRDTKKNLVTIMRVNSIHHQAVNRLPENAVSIASYLPSKNSDNYAYNEAIIYKDLKIASVQYHPEEIYDSLAIHLIFNYLLK